MAQVCSVVLCNRTSRALCHCCQQHVCIVHLNEHNDMLNRRLDPFVDILNQLNTRMQTIDIAKIVDDHRQKLEQWRVDSHKKIDEYFEQKNQELYRIITDKIDEEREEINQVQTKITQLMLRQQADREDIHVLTSTIDYLDRQINNIEENFIEIRTCPLKLDHHLIHIRGNNLETYDLSILSPVYRIINRPKGSYAALASNDRCLLIHQAPDLCLLNQDLILNKRIPWRHGIIHDICWSMTLSSFILTTKKEIFLINEKTMAVETMKNLEKRNWLSCTCSEKFLFLSTNEWGSSIVKISLVSSKKFDKQWQSPQICDIDEYMDVLKYNNGKLAMIIKTNSTNTTRIDVRSSETLNRIWSLLLDVVWNPNRPLYCCPFIDEDWLVADYETGRLLHISKAGKMNSVVPYNSIPLCMTLFGTHILAVSTSDGTNIHSLNYEKTYTIFVV